MTTSSRHIGRGATSQGDTRIAFTLVEIVIVIGLFGLLVGIALPALMRARASAGRTASLSNVRSLHLLIEDYLQLHNELYPSIEIGKRYPSFPHARRTFIVFDSPGDVWFAESVWPAVLSNGAPWAGDAKVWFSPGADYAGQIDPNLPQTAQLSRGVRPRTSYAYSNSFLAKPILWNPDETVTEDMIQPVRAHVVSHPSKKALLWDADLAYLPDGAKAGRFKTLPGDPLPIAFADGHAAVHFARDAQAPVPNRLNELPWRNAPLHNTPSGVLGWDY